MEAPNRLTDIAASVGDGAPIDWARVESHATPAERSVVSHLRLVERIALLHAGLPPAAAFERSLHDSLLTQEAVSSAEISGSGAPNTWGPLTIIKRIGGGTYADVYHARDPRLDRPVALKLLRHREADSAARESDAIEEARLLARIRHPNVVTVYGAERIDGRVGIWMELIDGQTLEQELRDRGPFPARDLVDVGVALCRALNAVHDAGLLHRDVKAQNAMRSRDGRVVLADFGTGREASELGAVGELVGTPLYLAPELLSGGAASAASDIYSLGVLLYHLATGAFPVSGRSVRDLRDAWARGAQARLATARHDIPRRVVTTIDRSMALDAPQRYVSAAEFEAALAQALARPKWSTRPRLVAAAAVVALAVGSVGYGVWHRPAAASTGAASVDPTAKRLPPDARPGSGTLADGQPNSPAPQSSVSDSGNPAVAPARKETVFRARDWALIAAFENRTGDPQFSGTLEHALEFELSQSAYVNVVLRERVQDTLRLMTRPVDTVIDAKIGREVALRDEGIRIVLTGAIEPAGHGYVMTVQALEPGSGTSVVSGRESAPTAAGVPDAVRRLASRIRVELGEAPLALGPDRARQEKVTTPSLSAYQTYQDATHAERQGRNAEAEVLLKSALAADPDFASAHILLASVLHNQGRPQEQVMASAESAVGLIGTVSEHERYMILGLYDCLTDQNEQAIGQFEAMTTRFPDDVPGLKRLQELYILANRGGDADRLFVRMANARPADFVFNARAAQELVQSFGLESARPYINRALTLLPDTRIQTTTWPVRTWLLLLPAHELWTQGRAREATAVLDEVETRPELVAEGRTAFNLLGQLRMALGQLRAAERAFAHIDVKLGRSLSKAEIALAREDREAVVTQLTVDDVASVSLLVHAGDFGAAEQMLHRLQNVGPTGMQWASQEIDEARGDRATILAAIDAGTPWAKAMTGMKAFLYSETLARAAADAGETAAAIRVLEESRALGRRAYAPVTQSGFYWARTQKLLADVYRQQGDIARARVIEGELLAVLAVADDDYPLLRELKSRGGN